MGFVRVDMRFYVILFNDPTPNLDKSVLCFTCRICLKYFGYLFIFIIDGQCLIRRCWGQIRFVFFFVFIMYFWYCFWTCLCVLTIWTWSEFLWIFMNIWKLLDYANCKPLISRPYHNLTYLTLFFLNIYVRKNIQLNNACGVFKPVLKLFKITNTSEDKY